MPFTEVCGIVRVEGGKRAETEDLVVLETPLEISVDGTFLDTLYCSPDSLEALVYGHLLGMGAIQSLNEVIGLSFSEDRRKVMVNFRGRTAATLFDGGLRGAGGAPVDGQTRPGAHFQRNLAEAAPDALFTVRLAHIERVAEAFMPGSDNFRNTGALHSAALCRDDRILIYKEDVSRHCAFDKAVGEALMQGISLGDCYVMTSGRIPRDMFEKVIQAGLPAVFSRSAPTREAVLLARKTGKILGGFVRKGRMNLYSGAGRVL